MNPLYHRARFLLGAAKLSQAPEDTGHEVAFAGRSNVGKSSALNAITQQRSLARTSKTPGRTQQINFFILDETRRLVDLPGYGYAKVPAAVKAQWQAELSRYLAERQSLRGLIMLMDIRRPFTEFDQHMLTWCCEAGLPCCVLLTKADKLSRGAAAATLQQVKATLKQEYTPLSGADHERRIDAILFSALKKQGIDAVHRQLDQWLQVESAVS